MMRTINWESRISERYIADREQEKPVVILAIETSCDETSVAVVQDGRKILSNVISSQIDIHQRFGGVVPEIASRRHVEGITVIMEEALQRAGVGLADISAVAVTYGPGLVGALLVGISAAKSLSLACGIPLIGVNHMSGHIYANRLVEEMQFPLIALVVSGGHTELVLMEDHDQYRILGQTRDDAAGEAYDKVARALQLPYPGGPHIDRLAEKGEEAWRFPRAWLEADSYDFSFSGLKSAVLNAINQARQRGETIKMEDAAASFQAAVVEVLVGKTVRAAQEYGARQVLMAGGVAANRGLRKALAEQMDMLGIPLCIPSLDLCTDNAAMIGAAAHFLYEKGRFSGMDLNAVPGLSLSEIGNPE